MTYENFLKVGLQLQKQDRIINNLYTNSVDLIEFVDPYHDIINTLIKEIYGDEGVDWFSWFCYESEFGQKDWSTAPSYEKNEEGIFVKVKETGEVRYGATDKDGNPICYDWKSLWEYLEELRINK
jgi:hypothetical protein